MTNRPNTIPFGTFVTIAHDGFAGTVQGHYVTREGKTGVVLQQHGTRVVHVYGEKWATAGDAPKPLAKDEPDKMPGWNDQAAFQRFIDLFDADGVEGMTEDQWGEWVNSLPRDEFFAMISSHLDKEAP